MIDGGFSRILIGTLNFGVFVKLTSSAMSALFWRGRNSEVDNCTLMYCFGLWSWVQHACRWTKCTCLGCHFLRIITLQSSLVIVLSWATSGQWLYWFISAVAGESRNKCSRASWNPATPWEIPGLYSYIFNYLEYVHSCDCGDLNLPCNHLIKTCSGLSTTSSRVCIYIVSHSRLQNVVANHRVEGAN